MKKNNLFKLRPSLTAGRGIETRSNAGNPAKINVESYVEPKIYQRILQLKERWQKVVGREIKWSPFLAMVIEKGLKPMEEHIKRLETS